MKTSHLPFLLPALTRTHARSLNSLECRHSFCIQLDTMMHRMNKVISAAEWDGAGGRNQGEGPREPGLKGARPAGAARVRAQLLLGVKGDPGAGWTDSRKPNKNQSCQIKTSQIGTLTDPFLKLLNTLHTFKSPALVCIMGPSQGPSSV